MSQATIDPDVSELDALKQMVESDGWQFFLRAVERQWGAEACLNAIDRALGTVPRGDREAQDDTVTQIRAAARAVQGMVAWPSEQIARLHPDKKGTHRLAAWRRA